MFAGCPRRERLSSVSTSPPPPPAPDRTADGRPDVGRQDLQVPIEGSIDDPGRCRALLEDWLPADADRDIILLVASELVTNAVLHGAGERFLRATRDDGTVRIGVVDQSPSQPRRRSPERDDPTGRGLRLVERLAAGWGVEAAADRKEVWALVPTRPEGHAGRDRLG